MATAHIESKEEDVAKIVLMPGDPYRAKYIAENYLTNVKEINKVRGMLGFTGYYNNTRITVFASGMGIPSIGIYAYELFKFYNVEKIIRIGTCGTNSKDIKLLDVILGTSSYSLSTFPLLFDKDTEKEYHSSKELNEKLLKTAEEKGINIKYGRIITSDVFDPYVDFNKYISNYPNEEFLAHEMESFCLFYLAKKLGKDAACLLTVVDSHHDKRIISSSDREKSLDNMITIALDTVSKI